MPSLHPPNSPFPSLIPNAVTAPRVSDTTITTVATTTSTTSSNTTYSRSPCTKLPPRHSSHLLPPTTSTSTPTLFTDPFNPARPRDIIFDPSEYIYEDTLSQHASWSSLACAGYTEEEDVDVDTESTPLLRARTESQHEIKKARDTRKSMYNGQPRNADVMQFIKRERMANLALNHDTHTSNPPSTSASLKTRHSITNTTQKERVDSYDHPISHSNPPSSSSSSSDGKYGTWQRRKNSRSSRSGRSERRISMYGLQGWQRLDEEDEGIEQNGQGAETMAHRLNSAGKKMATCNACDGDGIMQVKGAGKKVKRWLARAGKEWLDTMGYWAAQEGTEGWVLH